MRIISLRIFLMLSLLIGCSTPDLVWAKAATELASPNVKVEQWVGKGFTFLDLPTEQQAAGYDIFREDQGDKGFEGDLSVRIPYNKYFGKEVTVTAVVAFPAGYDRQEYMVHMKVNKTGEKLIGRTRDGQLEGVVLTADLKNARRHFLGKTIYPKFRMLPGLYMADLNKMSEPVSIIIGSPVTVVDVYAGITSQEPIWLVVLVDGKKAILPITYSWTNIPIHRWRQTPGWQESLFTENPKVVLGGTQEVWNEIQDGTITEGMTKGHIALSWGKPPLNDINDAVWIYGTKKLHFKGDVLSSIETITTGGI